MLLLGSKSFTVDGVTVFTDHRTDDLWVLPSDVSLATDPLTGKPKFTFIKYKPAAVAGGAKGGGFLMCEVNLKLREETRQRILREGSRFTEGTPRLAMVPFDLGTVECVALNLQGGGGTSAEATPPGTFNAVEHILGATVPELYGDYSAIFSLTLSQEGAIILEQAFESGAAPVGIIYNYTFTGLRPAVEVEITADFKRIYTHFSASLQGQYYFVKVGIDAGFERLKQEGAIEIKVSNFVPPSERGNAETWALNFFKNELLSKWFEPTLTLGKLQGTDSEGGDPISNAISTATEAMPSSRKEDDTVTITPPGIDDSSKTNEQESQPGTRQAAILSNNPDPLPDGYNIAFAPSETGEEEILTITGGRDLEIQVNGNRVNRNSQNQIQVSVAHGESASISITDPVQSAQTGEFKLFFAKDRPKVGEISEYVRNAPMPDDDRFKQASGPAVNASREGASGLRDWINALPDPKTIEKITGHASWERTGDHNFSTDANLKARNDVLARDRLVIAKQIIGSSATIQNERAMSDDVARTAGRSDDMNDRVVLIKGVQQQSQDEVNITATLSRPERPSVPPGDSGNGDRGKNGDGDRPTSDKKDGKIAGDPAIALKLKFLRQEEMKKLTFTYNRAEAVQRTHAPQGLIGLMLEGLDKDEHFIEVDLDDPFFRQFKVSIEAPIDFEQIGLTSAHVALDYGDPADPENHRHGDFIFDADGNDQQNFEVFMNGPADTEYQYQTQYHFDPASGWDGERFTYDLEPITTEDRTLLLNPYEQLGFLEISVEPTEIDWAVLNRVEVFLTYDSGTGWTPTKQLTFTENADAAGTWKLRIEDPQRRDYSYQLIYYFKDGAKQTTDPETTQATRLSVNDPFEQALSIEFLPLFDTSSYRLVFIDVNYHDEDNNYHREERLQLRDSSLDPVNLRISLMNPQLREFTYRFTFVGNDNSLTQNTPVTTTETLIGVSPAD